MAIELIGLIADATTIATGRGIREIDRLIRVYGPGRWRKRKGLATVPLPDGSLCRAEVHWYEAHGVGRKRIVGQHP